MQAPHDGARGDARKRHQDPSGAVNAGTPVEPVPAADAAAPGVASPFRTVPNGVPDEAKEKAAPTAVPAAPESDPGDGANGRLSDRARSGYAVEVCRCEEGAYLGARKAGTPCRCERCGFMTADQLAAIVREHTERALAEVEQRIEHGPHRLGHNVSVVCSCVRCEATHACLAIVRAAREEQS